MSYDLYPQSCIQNQVLTYNWKSNIEQAWRMIGVFRFSAIFLSPVTWHKYSLCRRMRLRPCRLSMEMTLDMSPLLVQVPMSTPLQISSPDCQCINVQANIQTIATELQQGLLFIVNVYIDYMSNWLSHNCLTYLWTQASSLASPHTKVYQMESERL